MKIALEVFGGLLVLATLAPLIKTQYWWIRVFDFPKAQVAFLAIVTLVAYLWFFGPSHTLEWVFVFLLGGAILIQSLFVLPFTPLYKEEALASEGPEHQNLISFLIANVRMRNQSYASFLEVVSQNDPDLLLINEPDHQWASALAELDETYPYQIKCPLDNTYGMIFYSKFRLLEHQINFLIKEDIPSFYAVLQLPSGLKFDLFTVHPEPPRLGNDTDTREAELLTVGRMAKKTSYPSIVAGDLNDVAWSHTTRLFKRISEMLDPRIGRGLYNTYNAYTPFLRYPLDHIFYHPDFRLVRLTRLSKFGSDHLPILVVLNYEPAEANQQPTPSSDAKDREEAQDLIQKGKDA